MVPEVCRLCNGSAGNVRLVGVKGLAYGGKWGEVGACRLAWVRQIGQSGRCVGQERGLPMMRQSADAWWWGLPVRVQAGMLAGALVPWCWLGVELVRWGAK